MSSMKNIGGFGVSTKRFDPVLDNKEIFNLDTGPG
jgi:hypothetical protein